MKTGIELIAEERKHQIDDLGFTPEKDQKLDKGELLMLAQYCVLSNEDHKPTKIWSKDYLAGLHLKTRIEQLTIAGAVIAAEIDRRLQCLKDHRSEENEEIETTDNY